MPKYQITAPDGRIVVVEGTKPPTEQDAAAIFAQIGSKKKEDTVQAPYSAMDKVKYTLRAAGEAAPFGMGDLVAGYVGAQARNLADYTHGKDLKTRVKGLGKLAFGIINPEDFKKERADFIREQEEFAKHHGGLNFAGEMAGGLLTGGAGAARNVIGKQGLKALMNAGAREGAKFGAAYGAGSELTKDTDKLSVPNALIGAGTGLAGGAVMGAALPPAIVVGAKALSPVVKSGQAFAKKISTILKNDAKQANQALGNAGYVATDLAPENKDFLKLFADNPEGTMAAIESGDPLIAHANSLQLGKTKGAIVANENAEQAYLAAKRAFDDKKIAKGGKFADILLGENSGKEAAERIADEAHSKYQPLYEEVMKMGEIDLPQEIISNETILGAIQEAQGRAGYTKLKANNVRVLDKAKRVLQDKYKSLKKAGKNDEAIEYQLAKEELVNFMDSKLPQYAEARKAFMTGKELEDFVAKGQDIKTLSIKDVENLSKTMSPEEKEAFKSGVADVVRSSLDKTQKEGSDVIGKAFDLPLRRKLNILGIGDDDLIKEIAQEMKTNANFRAVGYGSDTAVNLRNAMKFKGPFSKAASVVEAVTSPVRTIKSLAEVADNKLQQLSAEEIARLMFDPKALAEEAQKPQHQRKIAEILRKSKQDKSGQSIAGYLGGKLKEKGGYAMKDIQKYEGEPFSKIEGGIENFKKWSNDAPFVKSNEEALNRPFKTGEKVVVKAYHGTQRADRVGNVFQPNRATSGPMPMFSSSEEIAQGYMRNKTDTSIRANEDISYENWFRIKNKGKETKLDEAWYKLSPKQRAEIAKNAPHITQDDQAMNIIYDQNNWSGLGGYNEHLREANGNHLKALVDEWLNSGSLYDSEEQFAEVLKKAGLKESQFVYDNPNAVKGAVFDTYIQFKKPLVTNDIPKKVINKLEEVSKQQPIPDTRFGVDLWDKNTRHPLEWIKELKEDYKNGKNSFAWTSIPDWVTNVLKDFGYDGIIDQGGKGVGSEIHRVYIPFKSNQIKSVKNSGTFSKRSPNIYKSLIGGLGISQILKNKESK